MTKNIRHMSDMEHIRYRPGMYIVADLVTDRNAEDGIYVLLKEIVIILSTTQECRQESASRLDIEDEWQ